MKYILPNQRVLHSTRCTRKETVTNMCTKRKQ